MEISAETSAVAAGMRQNSGVNIEAKNCVRKSSPSGLLHPLISHIQPLLLADI